MKDLTAIAICDPNARFQITLHFQASLLLSDFPRDEASAKFFGCLLFIVHCASSPD